MPTVHVTGTGSQMQGVARLDDGRAVFIPFALSDETVEIEITNQKKSFAEARLLSVLEKSPYRVAPDCPYYGICGGCQARHMTYEYSLKLKREKVLSALERIGGISNPVVLDTLHSENARSYRSKAEFYCDNAKIGEYRTGSHELIDLESCLLQSEGANRILKLIKPMLKKLNLSGAVIKTNREGEIMLILSIRHASSSAQAAAKELMQKEPMLKSVYLCRQNPRPAHALDGIIEHVAGTYRLTETLDGLKFSVSPQSFFQVNASQAEKLYKCAIDFAELNDTDSVCDIYCGAGTITQFAARHCRKATGIEIVAQAIDDARQNASANNLVSKTEFIAGDAAKIYPTLAKQRKFDAVFVDPPRKGLDQRVIDALINTPAKRLIYVSCDPATLARDIKALTQAAYTFQKAQPIDMFPYTSHVETVAMMTRA